MMHNSVYFQSTTLRTQLLSTVRMLDASCSSSASVVLVNAVLSALTAVLVPNHPKIPSLLWRGSCLLEMTTTSNVEAASICYIPCFF